MMKTNMTTLTDESLKLFTEYAEDACNWGGTPCVGGNVKQTPARNGNLTDLKKAGLLRTFESDRQTWITFTPAGVALAANLGIEF